MAIRPATEADYDVWIAEAWVVVSQLPEAERQAPYFSGWTRGEMAMLVDDVAQMFCRVQHYVGNPDGQGERPVVQITHLLPGIPAGLTRRKAMAWIRANGPDYKRLLAHTLKSLSDRYPESTTAFALNT